jgi:hypothetical protein
VRFLPRNIHGLLQASRKIDLPELNPAKIRQSSA